MMTLHEAQLSLQLLAEERVGAPNRQAFYRAKAEEDAAAEAAAGAAKAIERGRP